MSTQLQNIISALSAYGVTMTAANWTENEARQVLTLVERAAQRLYNFALGIYSQNQLQDPQTLFRRFFGAIRVSRGSTDTRPGTNIYAENTGSELIFYNNAFFAAPQRVRRQSPYQGFEVTFTTEFLILHEFCHRRTARVWVSPSPTSIDTYFQQLSSRLVAQIAQVLSIPSDDPSLNIADSPTVASAGFRQGARSQNNAAEFSTDGLANWFDQSYTQAPNGFGSLRSQQMDDLMTRALRFIVDSAPTGTTGGTTGTAPAGPSTSGIIRPAAPLRGLHGENAASWMGSNGVRGWAVETVFSGDSFNAIQPQDYRSQAAAGVLVIVRWNYSYARYDGGGRGTFPLTANYNAFADWCAQSIRASQGVWGHIIGNEPNNPAEQPDNQPILPEDTARIFGAVRQSLPESDFRLSPAAVDPTNAQIGIHPRDYWQRVLAALRQNGHRPDFFALHAYGYGSEQDVNDGRRFSDAPMQWQYYSFRMWRPLADVIYSQFPQWRNTPLVITEANHLTTRSGAAGWDDDAQGANWVRQVYDSVASWNRGPGIQFVHGVCLYRNQGAGDPREIYNKPNLLTALRNNGTNPL